MWVILRLRESGYGEGDWFTRLRERWRETLAENGESSDQSPEPKQA
jgi:hypothetical protein